jgi:MSHA pilin protein MshD
MSIVFRTAGQRGLSLVELVVFIMVVSAAVAGVTAAFVSSTRSSADPMIQKQALSIAEAILEEVQLQPFTYCDPDDGQAATALSSGDCTGGATGANDENGNPPAPLTNEGETRAVSPVFDNVSDYNGLTINPMTTIGGNAITGLDGYTATVAVTRQGLGAISTAEALLIAVTVTGPGNTTVVLHGYRTRYAPNALP